MSVPTINDSNLYLYSDEDREHEIYEKYFKGVTKNMCVNEKTITMEKHFMAVADYVAKEYLIYKTYYEKKTLKDIHADLAPTMKHFQLKMIDKNLLGNFLKDVHIKGKVTGIAKKVLLSKIMDETFLTPKIRKRIHALMKADGYPELSKIMSEMENVFFELYKEETKHLYRKPITRVSESEGRNKRYRKGEMKGELEKGYDGGSYDWSE